MMQGSATQNMRRAARRAMRSASLGESSIDQNRVVIGQTLNAIPGVGPILSTVFNIGESIFGGGDTTPMGNYFAAIIALRLQIAQARASLGEADGFHLPAGMDTASANEIANLAMYIINDELHRAPNATTLEEIEALNWGTNYEAVHNAPSPWSAYQGSGERGYVTSVVKRLQTELQGLAMEAQGAGLPGAAFPPPPPSSSPPSSSPVTGAPGIGSQVANYDPSESTDGGAASPPPATGAGDGTPSQPPAPPQILAGGAMPIMLAGSAFLVLMLFASQAKGKSQ